MKKVSTFELLKTLFRNEVLSQQAHSAKFQAEMAVNKRALKKLAIKIGNAILVAYFYAISVCDRTRQLFQVPYIFHVVFNCAIRRKLSCVRNID